MKIPSFFVKILCNLSLRGHWRDHLSRLDTYHDDCSAWDESASSKRLRRLPLFNIFDQGILLSCLVPDVWEHWPLIAAASPQALKLKTPPSHKALCRIISGCQNWTRQISLGTRIPKTQIVHSYFDQAPLSMRRRTGMNMRVCTSGSVGL